jgi:hypothetical protein
LLQGNIFPSGVLDTLLLTPVGLSSDPLQVPEPGSLAVMALAMAAFAGQSIREHRRRRGHAPKPAPAALVVKRDL